MKNWQKPAKIMMTNLTMFLLMASECNIYVYNMSV